MTASENDFWLASCKATREIYLNLGIPADRHPQFFALTQTRYTSFMEAGEASPVAMIKALNEAIAHTPVLAQVSSR